MVGFGGRRPFSGHFAGRRQSGLSYLFMLFAIAILGIAGSGVGVVWHFESLREKERELLFIGESYRLAISRYYATSPGDKEYPKKLEDLLQDKRFPYVVRHLRKLYKDPLTPEGEWTLIMQQGRITGVASRATGKPIRKAGFSAEQNDFAEADSYAQWRFVSTGVVPGLVDKEQPEKIDR